MPKTGHLGTISFATSEYTGYWTRIGSFEPEIGEIPIDNLATTGFRPEIPDDLQDLGETPIELEFDATKDLPDMGVSEEITITFPKVDPDNDPATLIGSGFLRKVGTPPVKLGEIMRQQFVIAWDGDTPPEFTAEAAPVP